MDHVRNTILHGPEQHPDRAASDIVLGWRSTSVVGSVDGITLLPHTRSTKNDSTEFKVIDRCSSRHFHNGERGLTSPKCPVPSLDTNLTAAPPFNPNHCSDNNHAREDLGEIDFIEFRAIAIKPVHHTKNHALGSIRATWTRADLSSWSLGCPLRSGDLQLSLVPH